MGNLVFLLSSSHHINWTPLLFAYMEHLGDGRLSWLTAGRLQVLDAGHLYGLASVHMQGPATQQAAGITAAARLPGRTDSRLGGTASGCMQGRSHPCDFF